MNPKNNLPIEDVNITVNRFNVSALTDEKGKFNAEHLYQITRNRFHIFFAHRIYRKNNNLFRIREKSIYNLSR